MSQYHRKHKKTFPIEAGNSGILLDLGYTVGKRIGEGTYSKVCLAIRTAANHEQRRVAVKIIDKRKAGEEFIKRFLPRELKIVALIEHPNIVTVSNIFEINQTIYMFMDYCRNGDLLEYIRVKGPLGETRARNYFRQLVDAVEYLHSLNFAHRDLKCENVLITENYSIKLGDFGFARACVNDHKQKILSKTFCGSAAYAAPEILQGIPYDPKMYDIWALGCILYIMLCAAMPFDDSNIKKMLKSQLNRNAIIENIYIWKVNAALKNLIQNLLEPNVNKRPSIKQVSNCQWLQELTVPRCKHFCDVK